jgi:hypothetical protein
MYVGSHSTYPSDVPCVLLNLWFDAYTCFMSIVIGDAGLPRSGRQGNRTMSQPLTSLPRRQHDAIWHA